MNPLDEVDDKARAQARAARREAMQDLREALESKAAVRVLARVLWRLGLGRQISSDELASRRHAMEIMQDIIDADPKAARDILATIFRVGN